MNTNHPNRANKQGTTVRREETIFHPRFAAFHTWLTNRSSVRQWQDPLRRELVGQAQGIVLEVGAGGGQNFSFYDAPRVTRVEATEPDASMLAVARCRLAEAPVPLTLTQAPVEALPFPDAHFDSVVAILVLCSVDEPACGLQEIWRVLSPGGNLFLLEHVRARGALLASVQDLMVPVTTRLSGNCHWNRDTEAAVLAAGFQITQRKQIGGGLMPVRVCHAIRPGR